MAGPIRFRYSPQSWTEQRVRDTLLNPLDEKFGATLEPPSIDTPDDYQAYRIEMDNGDLALFAWSDTDAYWLGNTETPQTLWRTDKYTFEEAPFQLSRWAQNELFADLEATDPWLTDYRYLAWFFLPVFFSKDGRQSTRAFFRDDAAGFPDANRDDALAFYDRLLRSGVLEAHRYTMAAKLGTSETNHFSRMRATMAEFDTAKLLADADLDFEPEVELDSGHALDFQVDDTLVEVTRPVAPRNRPARTPIAALRRTVDSKTDDQLDIHGNAVLFVDCSSFTGEDWNTIRAERPTVTHKPTVAYRCRPNGHCEGYTHDSLPIDVDDALHWV